MIIKEIYIKNMVCPRCVLVVKQIFESLYINVNEVHLGRIIITSTLNKKQKVELNKSLLKVGFSILESEELKLIEKIKSTIIQKIFFETNPGKETISAILSQELKYNYSYLSRRFSKTEGISISKFMQLQKIEKVKELILTNENSLSKIAFDLNYSSVSHLSTQFKKNTGHTISEYIKQKIEKKFINNLY